MAVQKNWHRVVNKAGEYNGALQTLTGDSTATNITGYGVTTIAVSTGEGTAANLTFALNPPLEVGAHKVIAVDTLASANSTKEVTINTTGGGSSLWGTTHTNILFSTGLNPPGVVKLVGVSTAAWLLDSTQGVTMS